MGNPAVKVWFRAVDPDKHVYFTFAYGPQYAEPYVSAELKDLVKHIAYWWNRRAATLETSTNGLVWRQAAVDKQKSFTVLLDDEFHFYET